MKLLVVAVGTRMPAWVDAAFSDYAKRMGKDLPLELTEIRPESRAGGVPAARAMAQESARIRAALPRRAHVVALDERGKDITTRGLSRRMESWMAAGDDVALLIGGADGLDPGLKKDANEIVRLSSLTLTHAFARVLLAEQLYRAMSLLKNHPYHRD
jgi:23S rRNA (pseudouridine1915-N3)-methyltransferase